MRALEGLDDADSAEAAALMIELALDGVYRMAFEQIGGWADRALEVARRLGDEPLTASAVAIRAWGSGLCGSVSEAQEYASEAAALVDSLSDEELALRLDAAINLAGAELYLDRFEEAGVHAERVVAVARATGQPAVVVFAFMLLAWVEDAAAASSPRAARCSTRPSRKRGCSATRRAWPGCCSTVRSPPSRPATPSSRSRTAEESVELTRGMDNGLIPAATGLALAAARLETGDRRLDEAVELLLDADGGAELPLMPGGSFRAKWLELLARCWLAFGRPEDAERAAACAERTATSMGPLPLATAMADSAAAVVALASGDAADGRRACAGLCGRRGRCRRAGRGRALAPARRPRAGAVRRARARPSAELERAAAAFDDCGARRYRDAADHELRLLGRRVHRRTQPGRRGAAGVAALTERE